MKQQQRQQQQQQQQQLQLLQRGKAGGGGGAASGRHQHAGGIGDGSIFRNWLQLLRRRAVVAFRPRNLARICGAVFVALLLVIIVTKGYSFRRRSVCKCARFAYSQCQPYDGNCGPGVKKAFCQQKRCQPRRKLVRCVAPCGGHTEDDQKHVIPQVNPACAFAVRRQSRWTKCTDGVKDRSRILFLQPGSPIDCPATRTERRSCKSKARPSQQHCSYEPRGSWTVCSRERNEIVNIRRLIGSGSLGDCPMELRTSMRCLKRDGTLRCIYSKWTKWSPCSGGSRQKIRSLIQGADCGEVTRVVQNCSPKPLRIGQTARADSVIRR